jgi:CBS domain-containing protein
MKVQDIMTHDPACCTPETTLIEVAKMMKNCDCGAIPVVEDEASRKPAGIITDRDIVVRALAADRNPSKTRASECMTKSLVTVSPEDDLDECIRLMEKNKVRRILVVDNRGSVVGITVQAQIARSVDKSRTGEVLQDISRPGKS